MFFRLLSFGLLALLLGIGATPAFALDPDPNLAIDLSKEGDAPPKVISAPHASSQEFVEPTWTNLLRTMIRFNALDLKDQDLIDDYATISECALYGAFHTNEFKWNLVRQAVRDSIGMNISSFPSNYRFDIVMHLDKYDFATKTFLFTQKSAVRGVNAITIYSGSDLVCNEKAKIKTIPVTAHAVFPTSLIIEGIPLPESDARALVYRMDKEGNTDRTIYVRYNLRVVYVEPYHRLKDKGPSGSPVYQQGRRENPSDLRFDAQVDSVSFFEDRERTKLVYTYKP